MAPWILATSVPSITALRVELGYGDPREPRCQCFYDDVRAFRKKFVTSTGLKGRHLHQWKDSHHQVALSEMAHAYLEQLGGGRLFWPDDPDHENYSGIKYTEQSSRIKEVLAQLFFRLNLQQYRNDKYRNKTSAETPGSDARGASTDNPIDIDDDHPDTVANAPSPRLPAASPPAFVTGRFRVRSHTGDPELGAQAPHETRTDPSEKDAPQKSPSNAPSNPMNSPLKSPTTHPKNARSFDTFTQSEDDPDYEPPNKRQRPQPGKTGRQGPSQMSPPRRIVTLLPRKSPRTRRLYLESLGATHDVINATANSHGPVSAPTEAEKSHSPHPRSNTTTAGSAEEDNTTHTPPPVASVEKASDEDVRHPTVTESAQKEEGSRAASLGREAATPLPAAPIRSRPRIIFGYRVILSRTPCYECVNWIPEGRFTDKTLDEIKKEIPLDLEADPSAKGLLFTLLAPGLKIRYDIAHGKDDQFVLMKRNFDSAIRDHIPRGTGTEPLYFDIEIEALRDEGEVKSEVERWEGELEW